MNVPITKAPQPVAFHAEGVVTLKWEPLKLLCITFDECIDYKFNTRERTRKNPGRKTWGKQRR